MRVLVRDSGGTDGLEIGPHFARAEASSEAGFQSSLHLLGRRQRGGTMQLCDLVRSCARPRALSLSRSCLHQFEMFN
jgi:hypothetical protein